MMWKFNSLKGAALLGLGVLSLAACSGDAGKWKTVCKGGMSADAIKACTSLLKLGELDGDDIAVKLKQLNNDEDIAEVFASRGNAYKNLGQYAQAIQDYDAAITLNPENAETFYNRGAAKIANGDTAGGEADLAAARKLDPKIGQ